MKFYKLAIEVIHINLSKSHYLIKFNYPVPMKLFRTSYVKHVRYDQAGGKPSAASKLGEEDRLPDALETIENQNAIELDIGFINSGYRFLENLCITPLYIYFLLRSDSLYEEIIHSLGSIPYRQLVEVDLYQMLYPVKCDFSEFWISPNDDQYIGGCFLIPSIVVEIQCKLLFTISYWLQNFCIGIFWDVIAALKHHTWLIIF